MVLQNGSSGRPVEDVQSRLRELSLYNGPLDSSFGGGTEAAVRLFQAQHALSVTGKVDDTTWAKLFPARPAPVNGILSQPLANRCLALTATFETSTMPPECFCGITGNFDGQGLSFGALQWNLGRGTLQPLILRFLDNYPDLSGDIFHEHIPRLRDLLRSPVPDQVSFAKSLQNPKFQLQEPWRGMLVTMGRTPEFQTIQAESAASYMATAKSLCKDYGLRSQRALALMFDIAVQNGSISRDCRKQILGDFASLPGNVEESEKLKIIAARRAALCVEKFRADVLARKTAIATGRGTVHGIDFDLEYQFGLTLAPADA